MRYLGIDYGKKRVGVAISDEAGRLAFPKTTVWAENTENCLAQLAAIIQAEGVSEAVIGKPKYFGENRAWIQSIEGFAEALRERCGVVVHFADEMFTTRLAGQFSSENKDAAAAALILQSFLDRRNQL